MRRTPKPSFVSVVTIAMLCGTMIVQVKPSMGGPADAIVKMTGAQLGTPTTESIEVPGESSKVASRTGAFEYSYSIALPPGRQGMAPNLTLAYSSQNPIYGSLAAGWSLSLPEIKVDTSRGKLGVNKRWVSSLSGGHRLVQVKEPSTQASGDGLGPYRAIYDDSYSRYEYFEEGGYKQWRVRQTDGSVQVFGEPDGHVVVEGQNGGISSVQLPPGFMDGDRALLTHTEDLYGNRVDYYYSARFRSGLGAPISTRLERIEYTKNTEVSVGGVDHHAEVHFSYGEPVYCGAPGGLPVGASKSLRGESEWITGADRLDSIVARVYKEGDFTDVRKYEIGYEEECKAHAGATRFLTSITQSAPAELVNPGGAWISKPPVTFDYGDSEPHYGADVPMTIHSGMGVSSEQGAISNAINWGVRKSKQDWGYDKNTVQSKMIDLDGDGVLDRIQIDFVEPISSGIELASGKSCVFQWEPGKITSNEEDLSYSIRGSEGQSIELPTKRWENSSNALGSLGSPSIREYCSLSGQVTFTDNRAPHNTPNCEPPKKIGNSLSYRFMDVDSDGLPDLVTGYSYDRFFLNPALEADTQTSAVADAQGDPDEDTSHSRGAYLRTRDLDLESAINCPNGGKEPCRFEQDEVQTILSQVGDEDMWAGSESFVGVAYADNSPVSNACTDAKIKRQNGDCESQLPEGCPMDKKDIHCNCGGYGYPCEESPSGYCSTGNFEGCQFNTGSSGGGGGPGYSNPTDASGCSSSLGIRTDEKSLDKFVLKWYRNQGPEQGFFDLAEPQIMLSPIPLEMDGGSGPVQLSRGTFSSGHMGTGPIGDEGAFIDINGDGYVDTVLPKVGVWQVHLGDGEGRFHENPETNKPYLWIVPTPEAIGWARTSGSYSNVQGRYSIEYPEDNLPWIHRTYTTVVLNDANGDGLVDLILYDNKADRSSIHINTGRGFEFFSASPSPALASSENSAGGADEVHIPSNLSAGRVTNWDGESIAPIHSLTNADSKTLIRTVDWDMDGRQDLVSAHAFET